MKYTSYQQDVIDAPQNSKIFLEGSAGSGKTSVGVERMLTLMNNGVPAGSILIFTPQRTISAPYQSAANMPGVVAGGTVNFVTLGGLAQRMVDLFWPQVAEAAGFAHPNEPPTFLTLETAQYYLAHLVRPLFDEGLFNGVIMERNRIYSQIIDNLNKAAVVGFPFTEIGERLQTAWTGEPGQVRVYADAQHCATLFRHFCFAHNLLDFSLQVEVFSKHLWSDTTFRDFLLGTYQHLIVDNVEEDVPLAHDLLSQWLDQAESGLVIYDQDAGYRRFLGADPAGALRLRDNCERAIEFSQSFVTTPGVHSLAEHLKRIILHDYASPRGADPRLALSHQTHTYHPQMLDWVVEEIDSLISIQGVPAQEIAILSPFLSDSLRFSLVHRLEEKHIPVRTHRPSRSLREEPATTCLLTLAEIAHPEWGFIPSKFDVVNCLTLSIEGLDLVRAKVLADVVYRVKDGIPVLLPFEKIISPTQERITYLIGEKYDHLRLWLERYHQSGSIELDHFISALFGEVLSQAGFGFHSSYDLGQVVAILVESVRKFRKVTGKVLESEAISISKEYINMVQEGVIAAQYLPSWQAGKSEAVFIAPAYTFLVTNFPVEIQFWLDVGSRSWAERLYQPLTQPYVLSRAWEEHKTWTDDDEVSTSNQTLVTVVEGLLLRCRQKLYLGLSEYNEQGYEQRGPLLQAFHRLLQSAAGE